MPVCAAQTAATMSTVEDVILCFTPGALIATPKGQRNIEDMRVGDRVFTRDNGIQEIRWIGARTLSQADLLMNADFAPVLIRQGALGNGMPERDQMVSPNHRMMMCSDLAEALFGEREVLVEAQNLVGMDGIERVNPAQLTQPLAYIHMLFDHHEVVLVDGAWSESFQPSDESLRGVGDASRREILALFPELAEGAAAYASARRALTREEAQAMVAQAA